MLVVLLLRIPFLVYTSPNPKFIKCSVAILFLFSDEVNFLNKQYCSHCLDCPTGRVYRPDRTDHKSGQSRRVAHKPVLHGRQPALQVADHR